MRAFMQNFRWCCPQHFQRGILQPIYGNECNCGFKREPWMLDRNQAIPLALRAVKEGRWEVVESCTLCGDQHATGYVTCCNCNRESYFCWEFDFLKYLVDGVFDGSQPYVDEHFKPQ